MFIIPISQMPSVEGIGQSRQAGKAQETIAASSSIPFSDLFSDVLKDATDAQAISNQDAYNLAMGTVDDLHTVMINSEKATAAIELTVQLTTKAINAYNEIMRMQV